MYCMKLFETTKVCVTTCLLDRLIREISDVVTVCPVYQHFEMSTYKFTRIAPHLYLLYSKLLPSKRPKRLNFKNDPKLP